jgi:hypothetical protein
MLLFIFLKISGERAVLVFSAYWVSVLSELIGFRYVVLLPENPRECIFSIFSFLIMRLSYSFLMRVSPCTLMSSSILNRP